MTLENKEIEIKKHFFTYSFVEMIAPFTIKNLSKIKFKKNKNDKMQTTFYHNNAIIEEDDFAEYKQNLIKFINISGEILLLIFFQAVGFKNIVMGNIILYTYTELKKQCTHLYII